MLVNAAGWAGGPPHPGGCWGHPGQAASLSPSQPWPSGTVALRMPQLLVTKRMQPPEFLCEIFLISTNEQTNYRQPKEMFSKHCKWSQTARFGPWCPGL